MALLDNCWYIDNVQAQPVYLGQITGSTGATIAITTSLNVPSGATIFVVVFENGATASGTLSDGGTNTYTVKQSGSTPSASGFATVFVSQSVTALTNAVLTFTRQTSAHAVAMQAWYITDVGAWDTAFAGSNTTTTTALTVTSGTPTQVGDIAFAIVCSTSNQNGLGFGTGWTSNYFSVSGTASADLACNAGGVLGSVAASFTTAGLVAANTIGFIFGFAPGTPSGWPAVTGWAPSTTKVCGNIVRNNAIIAAGNERCFVCYNSTSGTGTTGATEPAWVLTRGALTTDNTIKWAECTGIAAFNGDLTNTPTWAQLKTFSGTATVGQTIKSGDGTKLLYCTIGGSMAASEPAWAAYTATGATTTDSSATWVTISAIPTSYTNFGAPHARVESAFTVGGKSNQNYFAASEHIQSRINSTLTISSSGVAGAPCRVFSVSKSTVPPTSVTAGATIQTVSGISSSSATLTFCNGASEHVYYAGFTLNPGVGNALSLENLVLSGAQNCDITFDTCALNVVSPANSSRITIFSSGISCLLNLINCTITFGAAGVSQGFQTSTMGIANFIGGSICATGPVPNPLFIDCPTVNLVGVDLSAVNGVIFGGNQTAVSYSKIQDCTLNGSAVPLDTVNPISPYQFVDVIRSDSSGTNYQTARYGSFGRHVVETTIVRTGGAAITGTGVSWNFTTTANANFIEPFQSLMVGIQNSVTAANRTVTMHGVCKTTTLPTNDQLWISGDYLGSAASPLGTLFTSTKASYLATGAALVADTAAAWGASAPAYQTAHAYGAFTGVILAGNANPQQLWFMVSHSGTGTSGSNPAIFNGQADGAQVTDNAGANQIVWQAMMRFKMSFTMSSPQPAQQGQINVRVNVGLASANFYVDPQPELS